MERRSPGQSRLHAEPALLHGRLQEQPGNLQSLFDRVRQLQALEATVRQFLGPSGGDAVRITNLRGQTLVLFSDSAAATTALRYQRDALLEHLRQTHRLVLSRLDVKVRPRRQA